MANTPSTKLHLESIDRIGSIPLVEMSLKQVESMYGKIKTSNRLFNWYFDTAEYTILSFYESVQPAVKLFESPLKRLDNVVCKSLDILEQRIPLVYLPPELMYWNTKEYMADHLVKPVLKRADSVKQIRNAVLDNPITTFAAERLDGALTAGDKFVDKYLNPIDGEPDQTDESCSEFDKKLKKIGLTIDLKQSQNAPSEDDNNVDAQDEKGAIKAIHHGQRFSRKLKRRLTQRTLAEARALKKQSREAIHILFYAAELIATDPKLALQKAKELWAYLSQDEPENQARPVTLEQLIVLLTRESVRRLVHVANFGVHLAANIPKTVAHTSTEVTHHIIYFNNRLINITKLDKVRNLSKEEAHTLIKRMVTFYGNLQNISNVYLERLATFLSGRIEAEKVSGNRASVASTTSIPSTRRRTHDVQENNTPTPSSHNNINGVY